MTAPVLRALQRDFKARVRPGGGDAAALPLAAQRGVPGEARLAVYAGGYTARIEEALAEVYEAVRVVVGAKAFRALSQDYAAAHPSHDYNLSLTGRHLPAHLTTHPLTRQLPFLPDLATLEWRVAEAFHAFHEPPLRDDMVAGWTEADWAQARLRFQPSVALVESAWPILDVWEARTRPRREITVDMLNRPQRVLVFRRDDLHVRCEQMNAPQAALLRALLQGATLATACTAVREPLEDAAAAAWFAGWRRAGLIADASRA